MVDFLTVATRVTKSVYEIYPKFLVKKSRDLMIRGGDFYAIWVEEKGLWSTDEFEAHAIIDRELDNFYNQNKDSLPGNTRILHMWDAESGMIDRWHKYCQNQMRDSYVSLDDKVIFSNADTKREDYASKRLKYPFEDCDISAWETLMSTLYGDEERVKIEWAIGAIVSGESKYIQKFLVFYGGPGTGKSTVMNIIQLLFDGYFTVFDAKALTSSSNSFALEAFKSNPLVGIQQDGDLSRIEDNTKLNSLVSHELMTVNEKYRSAYSNRFRTFLFMGTNKPVKITDSRSGVLRRLIDVHPTGNTIPRREYDILLKRIPFELGGIAKHCLKVYEDHADIFDDYIPLRMMDASNDFYNFLLEHYYALEKADVISLSDAWEMYKQYCQEANVAYPYAKRIFKEEMKSYFRNYYDRNPEGRHQRDWYSGFRTEKFESKKKENDILEEPESSWLTLESLKEQHSLLDDIWADFPAQYANEEGIPTKPWNKVKTKLKDLDTSKLHYVNASEEYITIDVDLRDENGKKDSASCISAVKHLPPTYCELSKSGGLHLHYIFTGDISLLSNDIIDGVEIKKGVGNSALRRKLTMCNDIPIATISSGLPMKGEKKMVNVTTIKSENGLRQLVIRNLNKEIHGDTRSSIDFIKKLLDDAYNSGMKYDLRDLQNDIYNFASRSTNQSSYCLKVCLDMKFCSEEESTNPVRETEDAPFCFFDIEIFPNLFILCYKLGGEGHDVVKLINPDPQLVRDFCTADMKRIGFNCRRYDNHLIFAYAYRNYTNEDLYKMSVNIINSKISKYFIGEAYNLSYTDIYDFASAANKKGLKKLEIEMGIHHQEFGHPWNEPLPEELWEEAADYCCNDVVATEAAFHYLKSDWLARLILADIAGMSPNATTNQLSTKIIFGDNRNPQSQFNYRDLSKPVRPGNPILDEFESAEKYDFRIFDENGQPTFETWKGEELPNGYSLLPYFPGYKYEFGRSIYLNTDVGSGGYVYAESGMYRDVKLLDVASMHPSSIIAECLFGAYYTGRFEDIVRLRLDIKRGYLDEARHMFDGKLEKWLNDEESIAGLADALKTVINSVYGLTSASFENAFKDPRNIDNIVAKRGALFMRGLQDQVQKRGFTVAHIKTDSIKIPGATDELISFIMAYGREFGYEFEWEATYDCMTLVNDSVYIARYDENGIRNKGGKKAGQWTATGKQFAVPYIFKTLFTHEDLVFEDLCETFSTQTSIYLDVNEKLEDVTLHEKELSKLDRNDPSAQSRIDILKEKIARGHNYCFVGRTGQFCPLKPGNGGGYLYRSGTNKYGEVSYSALSGTSGRRWMESENVKKLGLEDKIDMTYFEELAVKAVEAIEKYGTFEWFVNHEIGDPNSEIWPF